MEEDFENLPALSYQGKKGQNKKKQYIKNGVKTIEFKPQKEFSRGR